MPNDLLAPLGLSPDLVLRRWRSEGGRMVSELKKASDEAQAACPHNEEGMAPELHECCWRFTEAALAYLDARDKELNGEEH